MRDALEGDADHFDIRNPLFNDPDIIYDVYSAMRNRAPIIHTDRPDFGGRHPESWLVIGYEECYQVLRDRRHTTSDYRRALPPDSELAEESDGLTVIGMDPPEQQELRRALNPYFTPERIARLEPVSREITNKLIDEFIEDGHGDLAKVAWTFPGVILFREILGIPVELIEDCLYWQGRSMHGEDQAIRDEGSAKLYEIVAMQLASRKDQPTRGDVVDAMFTASIGGRHLTLEELIANGALLVAAGLETTSNALTSAYYWLAHHPDDRARLIADPSLMPTAVEELLRYLGSVHSLLRYATKDMEVSGHQFKRGDVIQVGYAAANRDPREFVDAERCQLDRRSNRHLAFGVGAHRCLGSNLARMELKVGLQEVLRRLPDYRIPDESACHFVGTYVTRGYHVLPVTFTPGRRESLESNTRPTPEY